MKKIWIVVMCMMLVVPLNAQIQVFSETVELKNREDFYEQQKLVVVYIEKGQTYETESRIVFVSITPTESAYIEGEERKEYFSSVSVYIAIKTEEGDTSEEFTSYLNFDTSEKELFWDHAGHATADKAGKTFGEDDPLTVKDQYLEVTLDLTHLKLSEYRCDGCESDADSYIFMDIIRFRVGVDYSDAQEDMLEKFGDAQEYVTKGHEYYYQGEFEDAKDEFQKAKDIFDEKGDRENSDDMQEWINKCSSYDSAGEYLKDGIDLFTEASTIEDYQGAINKYEEARTYFQKAKTEFDYAGNEEKADECEDWIERCDDEIENLESVGELRGNLVYIILAIVVVGGAVVLIKQLGKGKGKQKGKPAPAATPGLSLRVRDTETGQEVSIAVAPTDKMGKVRQMAATKLGMVPSGLQYRGTICPPDRTVQECGLTNGCLVEAVPMGREPDQTTVYDNREKLAQLEQRYREGKISRELYESLKRKLE